MKEGVMTEVSERYAVTLGARLSGKTREMESRGTGLTTRQMRSAPNGAIFVWVNGHLSYPRDIARHLGRSDLEIVAPSWLEGHHWRGRYLSGLVIDHACALTHAQSAASREA